jgi:hypothetical protein
VEASVAASSSEASVSATRAMAAVHAPLPSTRYVGSSTVAAEPARVPPHATLAQGVSAAAVTGGSPGGHDKPSQAGHLPSRGGGGRRRGVCVHLLFLRSSAVTWFLALPRSLPAPG